MMSSQIKRSMVQLFVKTNLPDIGTVRVHVRDEKDRNDCIDDSIFSCSELSSFVSRQTNIEKDRFYLTTLGGNKSLSYRLGDDKGVLDLLCDNYNGNGCCDRGSDVWEGTTLEMKMRILGGIDFQHREGSKIGSGGMQSESQAALERRERLRKLALESIDISKDPYFMKNHLGTFECKLCLTLHKNEGNYLAHTQGKRHQANLSRRAAQEEKNLLKVAPKEEEVKTNKSIKIGRPGYKVLKSRDSKTNQRTLSFEIDYPESAEGIQPRHRFMSAYEQKVEAPDRDFQFLLVACAPYETIGFKIPNEPIDRNEGKFFTRWDADTHKFVLTLMFLEGEDAVNALKVSTAASAPRPVIRYTDRFDK